MTKTPRSPARRIILPADYEARIQALMDKHGCASRNDLIRLALHKLEQSPDGKTSAGYVGGGTEG